MHTLTRPLVVIILVCLWRSAWAGPASESPVARIRVEPVLESLLDEEDTDHDSLITSSDQGDRRFTLRDEEGHRLLVEGTYALGNLVQELGAARRADKPEIELDAGSLYLNPAEHVSYMIRERYWDWLTRRIDAGGIARIVEDPKLAGRPARVYVPFDDPRAQDYFREVASTHPELALQVVRLPEQLTPAFVRSINSEPGILALGLTTTEHGLAGTPFVVPGGRFNEMYGWDSYFISLGLLQDGRVELARAMVDNFVYEIEHYGKILNANRSYYLTRSQPPFLTSMALAVYGELPRDRTSREWLAHAMRAAVREYERVWTAAPHLTSNRLSRYFGTGLGVPPEVEPGHFDPLLRPLASKAGLDIDEFEHAYSSGRLDSPELDALLAHDRAMRESGHDTSYRLVGRAADLNPVALNALLYKYESDLAETIERELGGTLRLDDGTSTNSGVWRERSESRRRVMFDLMWDEQRSLFFDYDFVHGQRLTDVSATTFYPLWAGMLDQDTAARLAHAALAELEEPGGIVAGTQASRGRLGADRPPRQWDYPFGWAPHQMIAWRGLLRCGMKEDARRLAYRWIYMIAMNASRFNGAIVEKYDVVERTVMTSAEYGNVGSRFRLVPDGGFGWTNASYQVGWAMLGNDDRDRLGRLVPPEWIFAPREQDAADDH